MNNRISQLGNIRNICVKYGGWYRGLLKYTIKNYRKGLGLYPPLGLYCYILAWCCLVLYIKIIYNIFYNKIISKTKFL